MFHIPCCGLLMNKFIKMNKAKEILYKHAKSNGCKSDLLRNPFLEQAVLNAINEALTIPTVVGRSEQLVCSECESTNIEIRHKEQSFRCNDCKEGWAN